MRRGVVTGGAGFVGSHVVDRLLVDGWEILVVDNLSGGRIGNLEWARSTYHLTFHQLDVRDVALSEVLAKFSPEVVFHLAAQPSVTASVRDPVHDASINILGTVNVLEAARVSGARKIAFASSGGAVYGGGAKLPAREEVVKHPESPYGVSKKVMEDYFYWYRSHYGMEYTLLALSNVYGPRQDSQGEAGVIAIFAEAMLSRRPPTVFGDGKQTRDFVYVEDVADAFSRAADKGDGLFLNIGTGVETSINRLVDELIRHAGTDVRPGYGPARPGDVLRSVIDPARAARHLGWVPATPLRDGLRRTVEWFRDNTR